MADYKRMVSYMYQYENGVKRKNVGYARIEAKGGQCKITLHMQLLGQLDSIFPTYLIQRNQQNMELVYLGDTMLKNQIMDSRLLANEANIMNSGHTLADMGGLLLFLNDNIFFATEWDDKPIHAKEVLEALKPSKHNSKEQVDLENIEAANLDHKSTIDDNRETAAPQEESNSEQQAEEEDQTEADTRIVTEIQEPPEQIDEIVNQGREMLEDILEDISEQLTLEEELLLPKYKLPRGWKTFERRNQPFTEEESQSGQTEDNQQNPSDFEQNFSENLQQDFIQDYLQNIQTEKLEAQEDFREDVDEIDEYEIENDEILDEEAEVVAEDNHTLESMDTTGLEAAEMRNEPATATYLFEKQQRINPFEDNEILLCVKIEPKDIGLLPKELWTLSSNSFLLHGFYCYHHLIFAKMQGNSGFRYILGIPGIFHNREKFMAKMFGFESFKSIRRRDARQGDFGYWYLTVNF
ncbi:MAG: DUF6128 domain-containing protein [Mobilitalea sp.]